MTGPAAARGPSNTGVVMYWLPLGARGRWVRLGGRRYEAIAAALARRERLDIYHSVLEVRPSEGRFVIEIGPALDEHGAGRGAVAHGPVAFGWASVLRIHRRAPGWEAGLTVAHRGAAASIDRDEVDSMGGLGCASCTST